MSLAAFCGRNVACAGLSFRVGLRHEGFSNEWVEVRLVEQPAAVVGRQVAELGAAVLTEADHGRDAGVFRDRPVLLPMFVPITEKLPLAVVLGLKSS